MKIKVIIEKDENGEYSASVPKLPGCESKGWTVNEAVTKIEKEIRYYIDSMVDVSEYSSKNEHKFHTLISGILNSNKLRMPFRLLINKFQKKSVLPVDENRRYIIH